MYKKITVISVIAAFLLLLGTGKAQIQPPVFPENDQSADRTETSVPPVAMTMTAFSIEKTSWKITEEIKGTEEALRKEIDDFHAMQTHTAIPTQRPTATPTNTPSPVLTSTPNVATLSATVSPSSLGTPNIYYIRIDNKGYIDLGWSKVEGAAYYEVYAKKGDLSQNYVNFGKTVDTRMTKKSPFESGYILFKVRACKYTSGQCGNFSSVKQIRKR